MDCYICYEKETHSKRFEPNTICDCKGSTRIHTKCLEELKRNCGNTCKICRTKFREKEYTAIEVKERPEFIIDAYAIEIWEQIQLLEFYKQQQLLRQKRKKEESCSIS